MFYECPEHPEGCAHTKRGISCNRCGEDGHGTVQSLLLHAQADHRELFANTELTP